MTRLHQTGNHPSVLRTRSGSGCRVVGSAFSSVPVETLAESHLLEGGDTLVRSPLEANAPGVERTCSRYLVEWRTAGM